MNSVKINEVTITVDDKNNVTISGHNKLFFESQGDVDIKGKRVNIHSEEETWITSDKHLVHIAPRIDLNPDEEDIDYREYRKEKGL
jgi:hypothetical protein